MIVPPKFLDATVALEQGSGDAFDAVASGVLVGFDTGACNTAGDSIFATFLATNRHVVEGEPFLWAKFSRGDRAKRFRMDLNDPKTGDRLWETHADYDVAVLPANVNMLAAEGADFAFVTDSEMLDLAGMTAVGVSAGYEVFVLGFPMGLAGRERKYAIVRGGVIARLDEEIVRDTNGYLLDCLIFPGNSGGAVMLGPNPRTLEGSQPPTQSYIIGIVASYLPYIDVAISSQTKRPRVSFEQNSGLASVVPMDAIRAAVSHRLDPPDNPADVPSQPIATEDEMPASGPPE